MTQRIVSLICVLLGAGAVGIQGQEFKVLDHTVQVHGFISQGMAYTDRNNYLTMNTSSGSAAMTDMGLNMSMSVTDKLRVGAQVYDRNLGQLGKWHPQLDWAIADYRFKPWLGIRAGKVKTALGLYNDTQDTDALFTWALLPQSTYPTDLRSNTISHIGVDAYGNISLSHKLGSVAYTAYYGERSFDPWGGYYYFSEDQGIPITSVSGRAAGVDVRWNPQLRGLMVGASLMDQTQDRHGFYNIPVFPPNTPYHFVANPQRTTAGYADYTVGKWHFNTEFRRNNYVADVITPGLSFIYVWQGGDKVWFGSVACRVTKRLELGTYNSRYYVDRPSAGSGGPEENPNPASHHIFDQTATARFDINRYWNAKVEGHFIDGYGDIYSAHGFYVRDNPNGVKPRTNLLVVRTGFTF